MDLKELKSRIYSEGTVGQLLEELGCDCIKLNTGGTGDHLITARIPSDSDNKRAVQVYLNENLTSSIVNRGVSGDIYAVVGYILFGCTEFDEVRKNLYQIKTYICNALDYEHTSDGFNKPELKTDWNWWLRDIQKQRSKIIEITENRIIDKCVLNEFVSNPWYDWFYYDDISHATQKEFSIGFHVASDRVTIPVHNKLGQLIGVKGRYAGNDPDLLADKKYSYIYPCSKSIELFNLHRALPYIMKEEKVIVVEAAKTVMMLWDKGLRSVVSIEGDKLSPVQAKLLKEIGLDIDLVFAFDKDKDEDHVLKQLKQIKNRRVFYLYDNAERFSGKDSPCDMGLHVFLELYKNDMHKYA